MSEDVVGGGPGVSADFNYDAYNAVEVAALVERSPADLLADLHVARGARMLRDRTPCSSQ